jgi:hypothetical protein
MKHYGRSRTGHLASLHVSTPMPLAYYFLIMAVLSIVVTVLALLIRAIVRALQE